MSLAIYGSTRSESSANVFLPKDRISMSHQGFGFCEFIAEQDAEYAVKIMNQIKLYGKPIRVNKASYDKKQLDVGANLFIGSLDDEVDENALFDTFSTFGTIAEHPKVSGDVLRSQTWSVSRCKERELTAACA